MSIALQEVSTGRENWTTLSISVREGEFADVEGPHQLEVVKISGRQALLRITADRKTKIVHSRHAPQPSFDRVLRVAMRSGQQFALADQAATWTLAHAGALTDEGGRQLVFLQHARAVEK